MMRKLICLLALIAGCGSQVVDFPEARQTGPTGSGGSGAGTTTDVGGSSTGGSTSTDTSVGGSGAGDVGGSGGSVATGAGGSTEAGTGGAGQGGAGAGTSSGTGGAGGCCSNDQCPQGEVCQDGTCVDPCQDVSCCPGQVCVNGECGDPCDGIACPEGKQCVDGVCLCDGEPSSQCGEGKTLLCHVPSGNPGNQHDICVGDPAVPAHLEHGDYLGNCK